MRFNSMSFNALGTINQISAYSCPDSLLQAATNRVRVIHDRMSAFLPASDVGRLNESAGICPSPLHDDTLKLIRLALKICGQSGGAFDITVRPLVNLWNIGRKKNLPAKGEIEKIRTLVGFQTLHIDLLSHYAFLEKCGQSIDLGGIAKGCAADEARMILAAGGVQNALINLGGNIVAMGTNCGNPWKIGLQNPLSGNADSFAVLPVSGKAIVTSGSNQQFYIRDSIRRHHILDPRIGYPAQSGLLSVTVVCECSTLADALSTAVFVLGIESGLKLLKNYNAEAVFALENGQIYVTGGLKIDLSMSQKKV